MSSYCKIQSQPVRFCLLALSVLLLSGCGGESAPSSGTSSLNLKVVWDRSESDSQFQPAALDDCVGVGDVGVQIYNAQGLIRQASWACEDGQAVIPANQWVNIGVAGFLVDSETPVIGYYGMASNVFLSPGPVEVEIVAGQFIPVLVSPDSESPLDPSFVELEWESVTGASRYRVVVADDCYPSGETTIFQDVTVRNTTARLDSGIYGELCWWVQAIDGAGNPGLPSEAWWFYIDPEF